MWKGLKALLFSPSQRLDNPDPMKKFLIAGLGNIGEEYAHTRHNVGFDILEQLAREEGFDFEPDRLGSVGTCRIKGRSLLCLKPATFMNRSGKAVKYWMDKEKIPLQNVLVVTDDLNLPFGTLRLKTKGSDGGHNGLKDIQQALGTTAYPRFRFGIGSDFGRGAQVDYVLGKWDSEEKEKLGERLERSTGLIRSFVLSGPKNTMNEFNNT